MTNLDATSIMPAHQMPKVIVTVEPQYIKAQSTPAEQRYIFAYHVDIYNSGHHPVQLMTRHWSITDGNGKLEEVQGNGVVGENPIIAPGDSYQYSSGAALSTEVGSMSGHYGMRLCLEAEEEAEAENVVDALLFDALIPVFTLAVPSALN
ncbi:Protein ApaG probable [Oleispira antarctica RB-8]|uniref:Protein ApaG n=1 Tax=Oleispira antarctica RB-8 TaxID=698738 RepID=R4YSI0_OLEAN|nr:Protein ApaG probable [Oleispira antarctica RB-8]|tara:strand:+ start:717 stop:1166 length:450 start_codon:yes stop_codon:yes gene_type:complete